MCASRLAVRSAGAEDLVSCVWLQGYSRRVLVGRVYRSGRLGFRVARAVCWSQRRDSCVPVSCLGSSLHIVRRTFVSRTGRRTPFPSMPVCFWGDPDGSKYRSAYFEAFEGEDVWAHGDFVKVVVPSCGFS